MNAKCILEQLNPGNLINAAYFIPKCFQLQFLKLIFIYLFLITSYLFNWYFPYLHQFYARQPTDAIFNFNLFTLFQGKYQT